MGNLNKSILLFFYVDNNISLFSKLNIVQKIVITGIANYIFGQKLDKRQIHNLLSNQWKFLPRRNYMISTLKLRPPFRTPCNWDHCKIIK